MQRRARNMLGGGAIVAAVTVIVVGTGGGDVPRIEGCGTAEAVAEQAIAAVQAELPAGTEAQVEIAEPLQRACADWVSRGTVRIGEHEHRVRVGTFMDRGGNTAAKQALIAPPLPSS